MKQDIYVVIEHLRGQVADISYVMLAAARHAADATQGQLVAVLLGHNADSLADDLAADRVLYVDHPALADFTPDAYTHTLDNILRDEMPRAIFMGDTTIGADVAGRLSIRLKLPLASHCRSVETANGSLKFVSQLCGGKIMVEGTIPDEPTLVLMVPGGYKVDEGQATHAPEVTTLAAPALDNLCVTFNQYVEPDVEEVDISKESILIAVGRGIQREDNLELAQELAAALGGEVCASRPVVDQGWLPATRLVGKSGKSVKPQVYLALGISGAPEHVEAIGDSELLIAINTDPAAPIFDVAKYGAVIDVLDLMPALTEKIRQVKEAGNGI